MVSGAYKSEYGNTAEIDQVMAKIDVSDYFSNSLLRDSFIKFATLTNNSYNLVIYPVLHNCKFPILKMYLLIVSGWLVSFIYYFFSIQSFLF